MATINGTQTWRWRTLEQNTLLREGQNPPCLGCWQGLMEPMGCPGTARAGSHSPIHADSTQVEDGGCAQHHIHGHQGIAQHRAEGPHSSLELKRSLVSAGAVSFQMTGTRPRLGASATRFLQTSSPKLSAPPMAWCSQRSSRAWESAPHRAHRLLRACGSGLSGELSPQTIRTAK